MAEKTIITKPDEAGRKLSAARRALVLQDHFVSLPTASGGLLTIRQCVEVVAFEEGWADNQARIALVVEAAERMKVNR